MGRPRDTIRPEEIDMMRAMFNAGWSRERIADYCHRTERTVDAAVGDGRKLRHVTTQQPNDPSPEQIAARARRCDSLERARLRMTDERFRERREKHRRYRTFLRWLRNEDALALQEALPAKEA